MLRIAEKLGFIKVRAVTVCAKVGIGRKAGNKKSVFVQIFNKVVLKVEFLDSSM